MTTSTYDADIFDRNGKRVRRSGHAEDGDVVRVTMRMMDNMDPALTAAMAQAQAVKRIEQFDAAHVGHRPGFGVMDASANADRERLRDERNAKLSNAWRKPPPAPITDQRGAIPPSPGTITRDELIARRDQRLENAWKY